MKRKVFLPIVLPVIVAVIGGAVWFNYPGDGANERTTGLSDTAQTRSPIVRPVPTAVVRPLPGMLIREFPGKVRANQRVQLAFSVPGQLIELHALEGRTVGKGDIIARLDPRDYRNALDSAKAKYADEKQSFHRTEALQKRKVVSQSEFDHAKAAYDMAAAELRIRQKALADTILPAPFSGVIASRFVENHEHIKAKQPIVSVQDNSLVEVLLHIPERLFARGGENCLKNIAVHLDAAGGRRFDATVREFSTEADPITRTYELVLGLDPPEDIKVLPGMTVTVRAEVRRHKPIANWNESLTLVPANAVFNSPDGESYVWLIGEKASAPRRIRVVIGEPREDGIEVRSGLHSGQRIAVAGVHSLNETMLVRPMREGGEGLDG